MNLTDLRDELTTRAASTDEHAADLLPGVKRKIRRTKQRRLAVVAAGTAAAVALGVGVLPGLTSTTAPAPAETPPADYTKDGVTLRGVDGLNWLDKGWIGRVGEDRLEFGWTPTEPKAVFSVKCQSTASTPRSYLLQVNERKVAAYDCGAGIIENLDTHVRSDSPLWLDVPIGKPARVTAQLVDQQGRPVRDATAQLAVGIYRVRGAEDVQVPADPADQVKGGYRFRSRVGGDRLATAAIGDPGQSRLTASFPVTGRPIRLASFCTANDLGFATGYELRVRVDEVERVSGCDAATTDVGSSGGVTFDDIAGPGRTVEVTATLTDRSGREVAVPGARIGVGLYEKGTQRKVDDMPLDELVEHEGKLYRLQDLRTAPAAIAHQVSIQAPADRVYLLAYGSSTFGTGRTVSATLTGDVNLTTEGGTDSFGLATEAKPATAEPTTLTLKLTEGTPTRGHLILAVYLPA